MNLYTCDACGAEIRQKKQPVSCPLCGEHVFSEEEDTPTQDAAEMKERFLMEQAEKELEEYMDGTEPVNLKFYNNGE